MIMIMIHNDDVIVWYYVFDGPGMGCVQMLPEWYGMVLLWLSVAVRV